MVTGMAGDHARAALAGTRFADIRWVAETGSTNVDLLELAAGGAPDGTVVVADHQLAGRGRLGRRWEAPPRSSLLVSVLLRPDLPIDRVHLVTMAVGLAAAEAVDEVAGCPALLKWPNDLVVDDGNRTRKLAGILAESLMGGGRLQAVVVGMGLNVAWPGELPVDLSNVAVSLDRLGAEAIDREVLLTAFLRHLDDLSRGLHRGSGQRSLVDRWRARSATLGRQVRVEQAVASVEGRAVDVTPEGHLVLDVDGQRQVVSAGDVIHLRDGATA
jgi:BirA family transcriptional regulator, biotin operon repressor / biotin---[acetyl-CoA-carboxylase] ligase